METVLMLLKNKVVSNNLKLLTLSEYKAFTLRRLKTGD